MRPFEVFRLLIKLALHPDNNFLLSMCNIFFFFIVLEWSIHSVKLNRNYIIILKKRGKITKRCAKRNIWQNIAWQRVRFDMCIRERNRSTAGIISLDPHVTEGGLLQMLSPLLDIHPWWSKIQRCAARQPWVQPWWVSIIYYYSNEWCDWKVSLVSAFLPRLLPVIQGHLYHPQNERRTFPVTFSIDSVQWK